ncbi:hypothetical protein ABZ192_12550 [Streptomyces sp. NPDC006235]
MTEEEARIRAEEIVSKLEAEGTEFPDREAAIARYMRFLMDEGAN